MPKKTRTTTNSATDLGFEAKLWAAADALRNNIDAADKADYVLANGERTSAMEIHNDH